MSEEDAYAQVATEVAAGNLKAGLWAKALAESMGNENVAKSLYLKFRAKQLLDECRSTEKQKAKQEFQASVAAVKRKTASGIRKTLLMLLAVLFGLLTLGCGLGLLGTFAQGERNVDNISILVLVMFGLLFGFLTVICAKALTND